MRAIDIFITANQFLDTFENSLNDYAKDIPKALFKIIKDPNNYDANADPVQIAKAVQIAKDQIELHGEKNHLTNTYWVLTYIGAKWCNSEMDAPGPIAHVHELLNAPKKKELYELTVLANMLYQLVHECDETIYRLEVESFPTRYGLDKRLHNKRDHNIDYADSGYQHR